MDDQSLKQAALYYHEFPTPGKISVTPSKQLINQRDLALAYSPGVAAPCLEIERDPSAAAKYTARGNLVAVVSNGTAVLGLGNIGPLASKPVMEGKGVLFKKFAGVDVFDIEIAENDPDKIVDIVASLEPTFGGINLEDIKAPECFYIEKKLRERMNIPVFHDDQHGTSIIVGSALLNALQLVNKKIDEIKIVASGAGAAALSCLDLLCALGVNKANIVVADSRGLLTTSREGLDESKKRYVQDIQASQLHEVMAGADMFLGLSAAGILTKAMVKEMAENPIIFALANPDPEILPEHAHEVRPDVIMATGRSDYPNQVNNVLGFPYIFRGALDVRARKINEAMKMAAVRALAELAKTPVPEQVNIAYGEKKLVFGKDYIIPKPFDPRLISAISPAVAKAAMESGVADIEITDWEKYADELQERLGGDNKIVKLLFNRAKTDPKKIVFAEADQLDVLKAAQIVHEEGIGIPILLGNLEIIQELKEEIGFDAELKIIDPKSKEEDKTREKYAQYFWKTRQRRGTSLLDAQKWMRERNYFAAMMINAGDADCLVTGYSRSYPNVVKPVMELIDRQQGVSRIATTNIMNTKRGPLFLSDTAINPNPSAEELAKIALMTAKTARMFGVEPVIAMISFSNFGSSSNESPIKVREAVKYLHENHPELIVDGEIQTDFALNPEMLKSKFPFSKLANKKVNTLIFPNLDAANITYKMLKELDKVVSIGPIMMGLEKPVHIFQLGASVEEMVNMAAVAVVDAQEKKRNQLKVKSKK